jgi:hypothetical protein
MSLDESCWKAAKEKHESCRCHHFVIHGVHKDFM